MSGWRPRGGPRKGSAPAGELLLGAGDVRGGTARREADRIEALAATPELGAAVTAGRIGPDHLDSFVRRTRSLTADQMASLDGPCLVADASRLPADTFDVSLRRKVDRLASGDGRVDEEAERAASEFRHWFDRRAGMGRFSGSLDLSRYGALTAAIVGTPRRLRRKRRNRQ